MKIKKLLFVPILASSILFCSSFNYADNQVLKAEETTTSQEVVYDDKNNNGLPDEWEDYWSENISKSFTLGMVITLAVNILYVAVSSALMFSKTNKFSKGTKLFSSETQKLQDIANSQKEVIESQKLLIEKQLETIKTSQEKYEKQLKSQTAENERLNQRLQMITSQLNSYSTTMKSIEKIAENQQLIANNLPSMIRSGKSKEIK